MPHAPGSGSDSGSDCGQIPAFDPHDGSRAMTTGRGPISLGGPTHDRAAPTEARSIPVTQFDHLQRPVFDSERRRARRPTHRSRPRPANPHRGRRRRRLLPGRTAGIRGPRRHSGPHLRAGLGAAARIGSAGWLAGDDSGAPLHEDGGLPGPGPDPRCGEDARPARSPGADAALAGRGDTHRRERHRRRGERRPNAPMIPGSLTAPIRLASEDEVQWMGKGGLALAAATESARPLVRGLLNDFARAGLRVAERPVAAPMKWSNLLANLIANASGAILDMDAQEIYRNPRLFDVERRQLLEALAVMRASGHRPVSIPGAPVPWLARCIQLPARLGRPIMVRIVGSARAGKAPSLLLHLRSTPPDAPSAEPTEVAWMNGAVVRAGAEVRIPTPVNACLAALVEEVARDPERRAWFRGNPDRLVAAVAEGVAASRAATITSPH